MKESEIRSEIAGHFFDAWSLIHTHYGTDQTENDEHARWLKEVRDSGDVANEEGEKWHEWSKEAGEAEDRLKFDKHERRVA